MAHSKSEQTILDRIRAANDAGQLAHQYNVVGQTKGHKSNWRGRGYKPSKPIARESEAFDRLLASGAVLETPPTRKLGSGLALADHAILATVAASIAAIDLQRAEQAVAEAQTILQARQNDLIRLQSFVNLYGTK